MSDPYQFLLGRLAATHQQSAWRRGDQNWASETRARLRQLVGVVDEPWPEGKPQIGEAIQEAGYTRSAVSFPSREGWNASGWLLVPNGITGPVPAVICLPGHGAGADAIVGLIEEPYQSNFALQCVQRGWVTLAIEQVSFGRNRSAGAGDESSSCHLDSLFALELGETMTGWRVRDAMAGAKFLRGLPQVDGAKMATLGISGGGLTALWTAALDESICAAGVSGYFTPMSHSILRFRHCPDNYIPGLVPIIDVPDLAGLIAPRWLAVENGIEDPIFDIEGFRMACERAKEIYAAVGAPNRLVGTECPGGHVFNGGKILAHLTAAFS